MYFILGRDKNFHRIYMKNGNIVNDIKNADYVIDYIFNKNVIEKIIVYAVKVDVMETEVEIEEIEKIESLQLLPQICNAIIKTVISNLEEK